MNAENDVTKNDWEGVIRAFLLDKQETEEEKYLKNALNSIASSFEKQNWFKDEDIKTFFDTKRNKKRDEQSTIEFQRQKFAAAKTLPTQPDNLDWQAINSAYHEKRNELEEKYSPSQWIANAAPNASSVSFASHVVKLTHSKIDTPSVLDKIDVTKFDALTTSTLSEIVIDGAVAGNQYAPIFQFLELQCEGQKLATELTHEHSLALKPFANDEEELKEWNQAFKQASVADQLATHALLKQVYFPVDTNNGNTYHLLSQITSSSLAQAIFERLFSEEQKQVRKQYDKEKYSTISKINHTRRAKISVTASNHSNASQLNGRRGGKLHLLSTQPPVWTSQLKPPVSGKSWFDYGLPYYTAKEEIQYLRDFLLRLDRLELSTRTPKRRQWLEKWGNQIADKVLFHAGTIQALPAGWSNIPGIKLKPEQQYFLDPNRDDAEFQAKRTATDWQPVICREFAHWLNRRLKGKDKKFTPQPEHTKLWARLMEPQLRELEQTFKTALANEKERI